MRRSAAFLLGAFVCMIAADAAAQQKWPVKPIRFVVSTTPGSTPDLLARMIGPKLSDAWGQPLVIENRPGASGVVAATVVARSAPDGYTLHIVSPAFAIRAALFPDLPYDTFKDFATAGEIGFSNSVIVELPDIKQRLDAVSFSIAYSTPEQHETNLRNDVAIFRKIVKEAGLRPQ